MKHLEKVFTIANFAAEHPELLGVPFETACNIVSKLPTPKAVKDALAHLTAYNFYVTGRDPMGILKSDDDIIEIALATFDGILETSAEHNLPIPDVVAVQFWTLAAFICNAPD